MADRRHAPRREKAAQRRAAIVAQSQRELPAAWRCLLDAAQASLKHLAGPHRHQHYVRTSTLVARAVVEERRRTTVIPPLFAERSLVTLVFGVLSRVSDRWGKQCFQ